MPQSFRKSCPWCKTLNDIAAGEASYCSSCAHRTDTPREHCDCRKCKHTEQMMADWARANKRKQSG